MQKTEGKTYEKYLPHIFMTLVIFIWGFDYVPVKAALTIMPPMTLLFIKYCIGFVFMVAVKLFTWNRALVRIKDLPMFILCALFGVILYFYCEYKSLDYLPVAMITVILAFVPIVAILIDRIFKQIKPGRKVIIGIMVCIAGVVLVSGPGLSDLAGGSIYGYLLCFGAVLTWNAYNYITDALERYDTVTLTSMQMLCTIIMIAPIALRYLPAWGEFTPEIAAGFAYLGILDTGTVFLLMVYSIKKVGPTVIAIYSNFLPVTSTIFGILFLNEPITAVQAVGIIIVIGAGTYVLLKKAENDRLRSGS